MIRASLRVILIGSLAATSLLAQGSGAIRFQFERMAEATAAGAQRLDIDAALLAGGQPFTIVQLGDRPVATGGLRDLRLFSASNVEIPYLLVAPAADPPAFISGRVLPVAATQKTSGFEVDLESIAVVDALDISRIPGPFLKRFRLEGSGDRERWTLLVAQGTAFNLPAEQLQYTRIDFDAGAYRYLRVTWDDTNSGRVAPPDTVSARPVVPRSPAPVLRAPVAIERRPSEPGKSRFRLTLPGAALPIVAFELTVRGGHLSREAVVLEATLAGGEAHPQPIGRARLVRVMRDEIAADALRIPVRPPREPQLELVVDDGDNPPLELEGVTAVFAELPWIYFEAQPGPVTVRYGDPRAAAPNYDLEALRGAIPATPSTAVWRSQPPVTLAPEPEGLPMPETGSAIALDGFAFVRDIPAGPAGLIAVPLDAAVMAHSGIAPRRLKDVRVIDRAGMQVPYLLEKRDEPLIVDVTLEQRALPDGVSAPGKAITSYVVQLPYRELPDARLVLSTRARVFRRSVTLSSVEPAAERRPARLVRHDGAAWTHADEALPAPSLTFPLPVSVRGDVFLLVDEGDNQPLPIDTVKILLPSYALRFSRRPDLPLRMVYGHDQLEAPRYDLQLLAPRVLGRRAEEIQAGPEQPANAVATTLAQTVPAAVFWAVLALAVIVLLGLVVGLMRREAA